MEYKDKNYIFAKRISINILDKMNKIIVNPDIHGRHFWEESAKHVNEFDKTIFLGDYFDPYDFEKISVEDAIENFKKILEFKKNNIDKVILLLGNHDLPYVYDEYYEFSNWHCRHSKKFHNEIHNLFNDNISFFQIAYVYNEQTLSLKKEYNDVLFTHAGVESGWLENIVKCDSSNINEICDKLNSLTHSKNGLISLFHITSQRGGVDRFGSCVWADVYDMWWDADIIRKPIHNIKQVFGHTMQAFYDENGNIGFGKPIEFGNCKMLDCAKSFILDCDKFEVKPF